MHRRTQHQNAQDLNLQKQCCEGLRPHIYEPLTDGFYYGSEITQL